MVVHAGEANVLVRQVPQLIDGCVYLDAPGSDGIEKGAKALLFDGARSLWCAVHDSGARVVPRTRQGIRHWSATVSPMCTACC